MKNGVHSRGSTSVLTAVCGDDNLAVAFLADRTTVRAEGHPLPAVTTLTREECVDEPITVWRRWLSNRSARPAVAGSPRLRDPPRGRSPQPVVRRTEVSR
jgi:hypothetical protein